MDAREDLEEANRVKNESVAVGQRLAQTQLDLEDREQSLKSLESKLTPCHRRTGTSPNGRGKSPIRGRGFGKSA
jgi:hypothetical protein